MSLATSTAVPRTATANLEIGADGVTALAAVVASSGATGLSLITALGLVSGATAL